MKIFFFDLDGTLLNDEKQVTPATRAALRDFVARGNRFAVCTGRPMPSALYAYRSLGLDFPGAYVIAYNGAAVYAEDKKEIIYRVSIPLPDVREIFRLGAEYGVHMQTYTDTHILCTANTEALAFYRRNAHMPTTIVRDVMRALPEPPCKCLGIELHDPERIERLRLAAEERFAPRLTVMYSSRFYLEFFPSEAGKGRAVERLSALLGVARSDTLAAGDEDNDISMLEAAGLGIAMKNGREEVIAAADAVTEADNNHDGLVPFLNNA